MLHVIDHASTGPARPLLIVHGLYGSARNWGSIAKALSDRGPISAVDLRNHGQSPWHESHTYVDMADDLAEIITSKMNGAVDIIGHSMGGKASMALVLRRPDLVSRLIIADIAPVAYAHGQMQFIDAMRQVDLQQINKRSEAEAQLLDLLEDPILAGFFTQSIDINERKWRLNLDALANNMPSILGFPKFETAFDNATLFLSGATSDYVQNAHRPEIKRLFPHAQFLKINGAGHWLHAEKPKEFQATVRAWLDRQK